MAWERRTITIDRTKVNTAIALTGAPSTAAVVDLALDQLIRGERLRRDVAAYRAIPQTDEELALASLNAVVDLGDGDVDYDVLYGDRS